jgi:F-type H+-transporting ATPase subunit b
MAPETPSHDGDPVAEAAEAVHGHEVPAGTAEVAAHGGEGGGLPQFEFQYWGGQIIWLLGLFLILYLLIAKVFTPRYRKVVETRAQTISGALEEARRVQAEADSKAEGVKSEIAQARADSRKLVSDARAKASDEMAKTQAAQDAELAGKVAEAETRIRGMREQAMSSVQTVATDAAQAIVEKLTGRPLSAAEAKTLGGAA